LFDARNCMGRNYQNSSPHVIHDLTSSSRRMG
jgi:hypothetical protein